MAGRVVGRFPHSLAPCCAGQDAAAAPKTGMPAALHADQPLTPPLARRTNLFPWQPPFWHGRSTRSALPRGPQRTAPTRQPLQVIGTLLHSCGGVGELLHAQRRIWGAVAPVRSHQSELCGTSGQHTHPTRPTGPLCTARRPLYAAMATTGRPADPVAEPLRVVDALFAAAVAANGGKVPQGDCGVQAHFKSLVNDGNIGNVRAWRRSGRADFEAAHTSTAAHGVCRCPSSPSTPWTLAPSSLAPWCGTAAWCRTRLTLSSSPRRTVPATRLAVSDGGTAAGATPHCTRTRACCRQAVRLGHVPGQH